MGRLGPERIKGVGQGDVKREVSSGQGSQGLPLSLS